MYIYRDHAGRWHRRRLTEEERAERLTFALTAAVTMLAGAAVMTAVSGILG